MEKVVFTTGGTGGHIYPALSIAKKVREKGIDTLFIGTKHRMEKDIVPKENFRFVGLDVLPLRSIKSVFKMMKATMDTIKLLKKEKPTKIIAFGNYITIPALVAANVLRIPYYLQEQNHTMGQANKWFYKGAKKVFVAFENTLESVKEKYKGASTISELIQLEKPSVLIPYDFVGQKENADVLEYVNGAKIFTNETAEEAIDEALSIVGQASMLEFMSENVRTLKKGNSAEIIVNEMGL